MRGSNIGCGQQTPFRIEPKLGKLGKHKIGGGCLYVTRLADVDLKVLKALVGSTLKRAKALAPTMTNQGAS